MLLVLLALIVATVLVLVGPHLRRGPSAEVDRWRRACGVMASWSAPPAVPLRAVEESAAPADEPARRAA